VPLLKIKLDSEVIVHFPDNDIGQHWDGNVGRGSIQAITPENNHLTGTPIPCRLSAELLSADWIFFTAVSFARLALMLSVDTARVSTLHQFHHSLKNTNLDYFCTPFFKKINTRGLLGTSSSTSVSSPHCGHSGFLAMDVTMQL
jgi:hypothetical protein